MRALTASAALALAAALLLPAATLADLGSEVAQGQQIANSVRSGQRDCSQLSADQLELLGEYAMDSYLRNRQAHEAINQHMVQVMGEAGERRMHQALGARFAGCPGAALDDKRRFSVGRWMSSPLLLSRESRSDDPSEDDARFGGAGNLCSFTLVSPSERMARHRGNGHPAVTRPRKVASASRHIGGR